MEAWSPHATAIIVCDMWNLHPCLNATRCVRYSSRKHCSKSSRALRLSLPAAPAAPTCSRGAELCPTMERLLAALRDQGATIIHAPSGCMDKYEGTPARERARSAQAVDSPPAGINEWQYNSAREPLGTGSGPRDAQGPNAEAQGVAHSYPVDQRDGGSDDTPTEAAAWRAVLQRCTGGSTITHQTPALTIDHGLDFISDVGSEVWNVLESRAIVNVLLVGVHTNMCVLGRPFGLRQLSALGKNVVLVYVRQTF